MAGLAAALLLAQAALAPLPTLDEIDRMPATALAERLLTAEQRATVVNAFPVGEMLWVARRFLFVQRGEPWARWTCRRVAFSVTIGMGGTREQRLARTGPMQASTETVTQVGLRDGPRASCTELTGRHGYVEVGRDAAASAAVLERIAEAVMAARSADRLPFVIACAECQDARAALAGITLSALTGVRPEGRGFGGETGPHALFGARRADMSVHGDVGFRQWSIEVTPLVGQVQHVTMRLVAIPIS